LKTTLSPMVLMEPRQQTPTRTNPALSSKKNSEAPQQDQIKRHMNRRHRPSDIATTPKPKEGNLATRT
jgi:hypothetical protein